MMPVALLPPVTNSGGMWRGEQPLTTGQRYLRGRGNSRWHRTRSATLFPAGRYSHRPDSWTVYHYWCGQSGHSSDSRGPLLFADEVPAGDDVCGTCVGRALGAGQDETPANLPKLRFDPRWTTAPPVCPGSRDQNLTEPLNVRASVGRCRACGVVDSARPYGRGYRDSYGMVKHPPGPDLVPPCPFHGWKRICERKDETVGCGCGYPVKVEVSAP